MPVTPMLDLSIFLGGMPAAGKTSLLGALAKSSETQPAILGGKLSEESSRLLDDVEKQTYEGRHAASPDAVAPYALTIKTKDGVIEARMIDGGDRTLQDI